MPTSWNSVVAASDMHLEHKSVTYTSSQICGGKGEKVRDLPLPSTGTGGHASVP